MHHKTTILVAPALQNSSCTHPRYSQASFLSLLGPGDVLQALIVLLLTVGVLAANLLLILVINSRRYSKYIHSQPRYLLTSLASNDLAMGLLVTPFAIVPSLRHCWPYGELVCQIQALLRGAISQQSAVILICMAMDRYLCMLHPARYHKHSSKKGCVAIISMTWIMSVTLFSILVLPRGGYYFNPTGMMACEPFYTRASIRILAACGFYFPTTMILMYCYGSAFHVNKLRLRKSGCNTIASPDDYGGASIEKFFCKRSKEQKPQQQQHCCSNSSSGVLAHTQGCDLEGLSEKYWGEILERTLSSSSLQALQRAYSHSRMERCNGLQEMKVFDTAVPDL
ncbi:trace amine-associated receptor 1 isoform X2 [Tenebrio molitor]|uniref:trace amine-associated receptor 1 isoform X2 n=1 Tax=Tenebrio molitor TaxID=7067 RepID=UPI00362472B5